MAKYINVAHSEHSGGGGGTPTAPRGGVRPEDWSHFHLAGFSFYHGNPMKTNTDVHAFLQKPAFMPWRKSRGDVDSFLRFETTLRVLFEAVVWFEAFWGQRGFWHKLRALLKLDASVSADTLEDAVALYCEGRRHCMAKVARPGKPPSRIAELAEIVDGFRPGEHAPISNPDWNRRAAQWQAQQLYGILCDQRVHSKQVINGTCAPELRDKPPPSTVSASPRSDAQRRERPDPRPPSPLRRPSLEQPKRPRDKEAPQGAKTGLPPKPPAPAPTRSKEQAATDKEKPMAEKSREQPANSTVAAVSRESSKSAQSLDELVATYKHSSAPAEISRKRSRDELPEEADKANKRVATDSTGDSPRPNRPAAPLSIETQQTLYENTRSRFEPTFTEDPPAQKAQQEEKVAGIQAKEDAIVVAGSPEDLSTESKTQAHQLGQTNEAAAAKVADRVRSPDVMSDSLFVEKMEFPVEGEEAAESVDAIRELLLCLEQRQVRLEALEASADSQKKLLEQWAADRKRIAALEAQLSKRAADPLRLRALEDHTEANRKHLTQQLAQQSSVNQHVEETMEATAREFERVKTAMGKQVADGERARKDAVQLQQELQQKRDGDVEISRRINGSIQDAKKEITEADFQNGLRFAEIERRSQELERQFNTVENRFQRQWNQHASAFQVQWEQHHSACDVQRAESDGSTEMRLADLQRQLSQVQEALQAREAAAAPWPPVAAAAPPVTSSGGLLLSNGLDPGSLPSLDTGTFLDTMYYEMSKLRTAMRTRIRAMDAGGVPDENHSKLAVSDISFELGRVLEVARKGINKL
ncbi:hypothetical protein PG994_012573 [Apiospora phragmitis]|uniref:Uncharacterized protein n=1 Tax=Apiospora phragmitis TaxID=2905665 RepID=A0ABR1TAU2_9PEZI